MKTEAPNYWVDESIVGDGAFVIGSTRDGGVMESFETRDEAERECALLNDEEANAGEKVVA